MTPELFTLEQVHSMLNAAIAGVADKTYSLKEVSERTGFGLDQLKRDVAAGIIDHVRRGNARRMTPQQVANLIAGHHYIAPKAIQSAKTETAGLASVRASSIRAANRRTKKAA